MPAVMMAYSCLRDDQSLTNPEDFQRAVPLFQPGDADMITARQTAKCVTPAHDVLDPCETIRGYEVHVKCFEFA